jgi:predicted phosphodiesterase
MKTGTVLCIPDVHIPHHDRRAWNIALEVINFVRPDHVVQLGDFADMASFSRHPKGFGERRDPAKDLEIVRKCWAQLEDAAGDSQVHITLGNHDSWVLKYTAQNAPELEFLLPGFHGLYDMSSSVHVVPYQKMLRIGHVAFVHDVGHAGKYATQATLDAVGHCVVHGHTHRGIVTYSGSTEGERWFGMSCGWLGDTKHISYMAPAKTREWQTGIGLIEYQNGLAFAQFCPIVKGQCLVQGKVFK